jgi:hypothetical protein
VWRTCSMYAAKKMKMVLFERRLDTRGSSHTFAQVDALAAPSF